MRRSRAPAGRPASSSAAVARASTSQSSPIVSKCRASTSPSAMARTASRASPTPSTSATRRSVCRVRRCGSRSTSPATARVPDAGACTPAMSESRVDLPEPLRPMRPVRPAPNAPESCCRAGVPSGQVKVTRSRATEGVVGCAGMVSSGVSGREARRHRAAPRRRRARRASARRGRRRVDGRRGGGCAGASMTRKNGCPWERTEGRRLSARSQRGVETLQRSSSHSGRGTRNSLTDASHPRQTAGSRPLRASRSPTSRAQSASSRVPRNATTSASSSSDTLWVRPG